MTKSDIQLLYEYDRWANGRVLQAASALDSEQVTRELGGGFGCVRDLLVHIVASEWGWITYWKEPSPSAELFAGWWDRCDVLFQPREFSDVAAVRLKWAEIEKEQIEFLNGMTDESLEKMFPFGATQLSLAHLLQHLANHSTYHRGQIALMMRQLGAEPVATDFHMFLTRSA